MLFEETQQNDIAQKTYHVLARRTRPQSFSELVGQELVSKTLANMLSSGKIPHAFLFTGTRGTGKTSSARILAKSICCIHGPTATPCQTCVHCVQITACAHDDVLEIDGASNTGVDQIRELRESARFYPTSSRYRIFVIDEVHMLSIGAFNALLKILEEPPPQVIFVLATTELHKVPITVRSRCMTLPFRKIETAKIADHLKTLMENEKIAFDSDSVTLIARAARGSLRDSLSLLEQVLALGAGVLTETLTREALGLIGATYSARLMAAIVDRNAADGLTVLRDADLGSVDLVVLLDETATLFKYALIAKEVQDAEKAMLLTQLLPKEFEQLKLQTSSVSVAALSEIYRVLNTTAREIGRNSDGLSWAEVALLDCISRAEWLSAGELLAMIQTAPSAPGTSPSAAQTTKTTPRQASVANGAVQPQIAPPAPQQPTAQAASVVERVAKDSGIDLSPLARIVAIVEKKSVSLAAKLKNASFDSFTPQLIQFSDVAANKLLIQVNSQDAALFLDALKECGFGGATLKGIELPKVSTGTPNSLASVERTQKIADFKEKESRLKNSDPVRRLSEIATIEFLPMEPVQKS